MSSRLSGAVMDEHFYGVDGAVSADAYEVGDSEVLRAGIGGSVE